MDVIWSFQMLGRLRCRDADRTVSRFRTLKAAGVLAYLAYHRHRSHSRDALIEIFWPEAEPESARHSLSMALSALRSVLEPPGVAAGSVIIADRVSVELNPESFDTDVVAFENALRLAARAQDDSHRSRHLADAIELYGGPLLPGFYEDWVLGEQDRLGERFLLAVRQEVVLLAKAGETGRALDLARRAVAVDPLREDLHAELIRLLAAGGQVEAALRQYRELVRILEQELGEAPSPALERLARQLEGQRRSAEGAAPAVVPVSPPVSLPVRAAPSLPSGTVTFLLTDIEGSTSRWEREGDRFRAALTLHHALMRRHFQRHGGHEIKEAGDSFIAAFGGAGDALACAVAAQRALAVQEWPEGIPPIRVRMALHAGDVDIEDGEYRGPTLHRADRIVRAGHGGQTLCSEAAFALLRRDLEAEVRLRDLGVYRLRDVESPERLFQVEYRGAPGADFPALRAERAHRGNLPLQVTRFFGRDADLEELNALLGPAAGMPRLITLTGPGGTGKTRLAVEAAARLVESYSGAVWFVPLADHFDPALIPDAMLAALRVEAAPESPPLEQIAGILGRQPSLLILDNLEQLMRRYESGQPGIEALGDAAEVVRALLESVPGLAVLVTSRQVLALPGEREFPVSPLPLPTSWAPAGESDAPAALSMFESVRLFVDRAQGVRPDFRVTNSNAPAVAQLCIRLEGIPLAIELAASRAQVLSPAQMLDQLAGGPGGRFDLLVTRQRGISERQRALRATVDWSYRLLSEPLQTFFCRLAVFRGGWTVEAAERVCEEPLALDHLAQLRDCSLVETDEGPDGIRFRMLETLRDYAEERLLAAGEFAAARERHTAYFLALAETAEPELRGPNQAAWLERLEADHDNFRAALLKAEGGRMKDEAQDAALGLRLVAALWYFMSIRGHLAEGRRQLDGVLAEVPADHSSLGRSALRARALAAAGALAHDQSDYEPARALLEESVSLLRDLTGLPGGEKEAGGLAHALNCLANVRLDQGSADDALLLYQEALGLCREAGDTRGAAMGLSNMGVLHLERGEVDRAAELLEESIGLKRTLGNPYGLAMSLESLGNLERSRGDRERSRELCEEALAIRRTLGHRLGIAMSLNNLGHLLLETGDSEGAWAHLRDSLDLFLELDEPRSAIEALTGLAGTMAAQGRHEDAVRLLAAMEAQREARGFEPRPCEKAVLKRWRAEVRNAVEAARLEVLWREGRALTFEGAVAAVRSGRSAASGL